MSDSIFAYVLACLQAHKGHWRQVADGSGVSRRSIEKIAQGVWKDPGVRTIETLAAYFRALEPRRPKRRRANGRGQRAAA